MGSLFLPGSGGQYQKQGATYLHIDLNGKVATISVDGKPDVLCNMVYDLCKAHPEFGKIILTVASQMLVDRKIEAKGIRKHTFFDDNL